MCKESSSRVVFWSKKRAEMKTKPIADRRFAPVYSVSEAAVYLGMPMRTLHDWVFGYTYGQKMSRRVAAPLIQAADPIDGWLSFINLVEAHVLLVTRNKEIRTVQIRRALDYVRDQFPDSEHPLITKTFYTQGKHLFVKALSDELGTGTTINASLSGQLWLTELDQYLERIERDTAGLPVRLFPMRVGPEKRVVLDIELSSGRPVLNGTGIMVAVLKRRHDAGESTEALAQDYGIKPLEVEEAVRYLDAA